MELTKLDIEIAGSLRRLFKSRFILRSRNEKWFQALIDHRLVLQKSLTALAVHLEINESLGVAYLRPIDVDHEEAIQYQMGKTKNLGPMASLLIFHLRNSRLQFFMNPGTKEAPILSLTEIRDFLHNFSQYKIDSQFERIFKKTLDELLEIQIIHETQEGSGFFTITPLCDILLSADQIQQYKMKIDTHFKLAELEMPQEELC